MLLILCCVIREIHVLICLLFTGVPCHYITPLQALSMDAHVDIELGCDVWCHNQAAKDHAKQLASTTDATVILAGIDLGIEAESLDRWDLNLPLDQITFINEVSGASKGPVVLVLFSGGGLDITFAQNNTKINSILWAGYPGEEGGQAIADVIYGRYNPSMIYLIVKIYLRNCILLSFDDFFFFFLLCFVCY